MKFTTSVVMSAILTSSLSSCGPSADKTTDEKTVFEVPRAYGRNIDSSIFFPSQRSTAFSFYATIPDLKPVAARKELISRSNSILIYVGVQQFMNFEYLDSRYSDSGRLALIGNTDGVTHYFYYALSDFSSTTLNRDYFVSDDAAFIARCGDSSCFLDGVFDEKTHYSASFSKEWSGQLQEIHSNIRALLDTFVAAPVL